MELELKFTGMTCSGCARTLEEVLASIPGVTAAHVSYGTKSGKVTGSDAVDWASIRKAVEQAGYGVEITGCDGSSTRTSEGTLVSPRNGDPGREGFDYDLLIIGTGGAGTAAAIRGSELGAKVAIVEGADVLGGTCVNVGCIPSKNLIEVAHHYHVARSGFPGITPCQPELVWRQILQQKEELVAGLRQEKYVDVLDSYEGITVLQGRASFRDAERVQVDGQTVRARKTIIATGSSPAFPPIPGLAEAGALDSTTVMELEQLPSSMVVIGAGAIGVELGQAFARFGVRVILVDVADRILPNEDPEVSSTLQQALLEEGIEVHTGVDVVGMSRDAEGYTVRIRQKSLEGVLKAEQLLVTTGRRANTEGLNLEAAGVEVDRRGFIKTNEYLQTTNPNVYAAGDVTGGPGYVYVAALQGGIAAQAALAEKSEEGTIPIDLSVVPRVTFTDPQVAAVGMTEEEARLEGLMPEITSLPVRHLPRAVVSYTRHGVIKLVSEAGTDRLLGVHVATRNAGDIIGEAVLAVRFGLTTRDLVSTLHPYLTWGEGLKLAAQTFTKDVAKLSCCA